MMRKIGILMGGLVTFCTMIAFGSHAENNETETAKTTEASEEKIAKSLKKLIFVPHDSGAPEVTDAGGVRTAGVLPNVELLAPDRMARSLTPSPTLYWHISKTAPCPVRFTLLADDVTVIDPLLELDIEGVDQKGIYGISLEEHGLELEQGRRYVWSIAVSSEGESFGSDRVAQTVMQHSTAPDLIAVLDAKAPEHRAVRLAADGYWYDAVDVLSKQIEKSSNIEWQAARARLLDQAGLLQAARFDLQPVPR